MPIAAEGRVKGLGAFLRAQLLPVGLVLAAVVGLTLPAPGLFMNGLPTQYIAVGLIFFCSGLMLRTAEVQAALAAWSAVAWGSVSILFFTPLIGTLVAFQLPIHPSFQLGLALFCCMPTTLSSGVALTNQARGNVALALMLTALTNLVGIFTVPFVLAQLLGMLGDVELSAISLLGKLCLTILLPLGAGKYLQRFVAEWVVEHRSDLVMVNNLALITIPWMKFSQSSQDLAQVALSGLLLLVVAGLGIHILYLVLNQVVCGFLQVPLPERKAVVLLASQKTLPVAMTVLAFLPVPAATKGLVAIPCITFHLSQIFLDAFLATRWGRD